MTFEQMKMFQDPLSVYGIIPLPDISDGVTIYPISQNMLGLTFELFYLLILQVH